MKTIATLNPLEAMNLSELLKEKGIPFSAMAITEESGLVAVELLAEDEVFDIACSAAEAWTESVAENPRYFCPWCQSINMESVEDGRCAIIIRCQDCGYSRVI